MELVDMLDLGSSASRRGSSSLPARTLKVNLLETRGFFVGESLIYIMETVDFFKKALNLHND